MQTRTTISANPRFTDLSRFFAVLVQARGNLFDALEVCREKYASSPAVAATVQGMLRTRSAIQAGDTSTSGWGQQLAPYGVAAEFISLFDSVSLFGKLTPFMQELPFRVPTPRVTGEPSAAWVGEAAAKPVSYMTLGSNVTLEFYKQVSMVVVSDELAKFSAPSAEAVLRNTVTRSHARTLDGQFLNPSVTLIAQVRPASVTSGATAQVSSGSTAAQKQADFSAMAAALSSFVSPFWLMSPSTAVNLAATFNASGGQQFPNITAQGGTLMGIPVLTSTNISGLIVLLDASQILYARDGLEISTSKEAAVEMDSSPISGELSPITGAVLKSLWQNNLTGIKSELGVSYLRVSDTAVIYMSVSY